MMLCTAGVMMVPREMHLTIQPFILTKVSNQTSSVVVYVGLEMAHLRAYVNYSANRLMAGGVYLDYEQAYSVVGLGPSFELTDVV